MQSLLLSLQGWYHPESLNPQGLYLEAEWTRTFRLIAENIEMKRQFVTLYACIHLFTQSSRTWLPIWLRLVDVSLKDRVSDSGTSQSPFRHLKWAKSDNTEWWGLELHARGRGANRSVSLTAEFSKTSRWKFCLSSVTVWREDSQRRRKVGGKNHSRSTKPIWEGRGVRERGILREFSVLLCDWCIECLRGAVRHELGCEGRSVVTKACQGMGTEQCNCCLCVLMSPSSRWINDRWVDN